MTTAPDAPALPHGPVNLLPCPFCAGPAEFERVGTNRVSNIVRCADCGARLESGETWGQGSRWNERAASADILKLADEIQEAFRYSGGQDYATKLRALVALRPKDNKHDYDCPTRCQQQALHKHQCNCSMRTPHTHKGRAP